MVDLDGSEPRYRLLESFRQYAREKLASRGNGNSSRVVTLLAYRDLAERLERVFFYEPDNEVLFALGYEEQDNWRAALQWTLIDQGDVLLGQRLAGDLSPLWHLCAPVEGRRWITTALKLVDEQTPTSILAKLSYAEATIPMSLDQTTYNSQVAGEPSRNTAPSAIHLESPSPKAAKPLR